MPEWTLRTMGTAAKNVEYRMTTGPPLTLSPEEYARFVAALDEAPAAVPELVDLFSKPSRVPQD